MFSKEINTYISPITLHLFLIFEQKSIIHQPKEILRRFSYITQSDMADENLQHTEMQ